MAPQAQRASKYSPWKRGEYPLAYPAAEITLFTAVKDKTVCDGLKELKKLSDWVIKWQMNFSVNKCKVTHMEENNLNYTFTVMDSKWAITTQKTDLGIITHNSSETISLKLAVVKKTNGVLEIIRKEMDNMIETYFFCYHANQCSAHILNARREGTIY